MEELLDLIITDESPSNVSDKIKEILFNKSAERIDSIRPEVASSLLGFSSDEEE